MDPQAVLQAFSPDAPRLPPGTIWEGPQVRFREMIRGGRQHPTDLIREMLRTGYFSPLAAIPSSQLVEAAIRYFTGLLASLGVDLQDLPPELSESPAVSLEVQRDAGGRRVSPDFLWALTYASLLRATGALSGRTARVLEVGPGYGALARLLKLLFPKLQVVLVDLPESLTCSYFFLRQSFPDCRIRVLQRGTAHIDHPEYSDADFIFVPAHL